MMKVIMVVMTMISSVMQMIENGVMVKCMKRTEIGVMTIDNLHVTMENGMMMTVQVRNTYLIELKPDKCA